MSKAYYLTPRLRPEVKAKWLEALRSGKYRQAMGILRKADTDCFCCLGVLCDISGRGVWISPDAFGFKFKAAGDSERIHTPKDIDVWACGEPTLFFIDELRDLEDRPVALTDLNDGGLTFSQIADIIEHFM